MEYLPGKRSSRTMANVSPMEQRLAFDEDPSLNLKGHDLRAGKRGWTYSMYNPATQVQAPSQTEVVFRNEGGKGHERILKKAVAPVAPGVGATTTTVPTGAPNKVILTQHAGTANPLVQSITSLSRGQVPHNAELLRVLEASRLALAEERTKDPLLNHKGHQLASDAENFFLALETVLKEKNSDEILQRILTHGAYAASDVAKVGGTAVTGAAPAAKSHAKDVLSLSRSLATEIATSGEFRSLLIDTLNWLRLAMWSGMKRNATPVGQSIKEDLKQGNLRLSNTVQTLKDVANPKKHVGTAPVETVSSHYTVQSAAPGTIDAPVEVTSRIRLITTDPNPHIEVLDGSSVHVEGQKREQLKREMAIKLRDLIRRFNANPTFQQSAKQLIKLMRQLSAQASTVTAATANTNATQHLSTAGQDLKELIMRLNGGVSLDGLIANLTQMNTSMRSDPATLALLRDFRAFIMNMFKNPQLLEDDSQLIVMGDFIDRFRAVASSSTYKAPLKSSIKEVTKIIQGFSGDVATRNLLAAGTKLVSDFAVDSQGKLSFIALKNSISQMRYMMMPVILKQLENVALPKIEGITRTYNYSVDNILFSGNDVLPEHIFLTMETDVDFDVRRLSSDYSKAELKLRILNVRSLFQNIRFFFQRKTFPKIHDEGLLDVGLLGAGTSLSIDWVVESFNGMPWQFSVKKATCSIDTLDINFKEAHHSFIDRTASKLFRGRIKKQLEIQIANKLVDIGSSFSSILNKLFATTLTRTNAATFNTAAPVMGAAPLYAQPQLMMPASGPLNAVKPGHHYPRGVKAAHYEGYFPWANWNGYAAPNAATYPAPNSAYPTTGVASPLPLGTSRPLRG